MIALMLDWLKTPMAAPETANLKTMRMAILGLAIALGVLVLFLKPLMVSIGPATGGALAGVVLALVVLVPVYVIIKNRADNAHIDAILAARGPGDAE